MESCDELPIESQKDTLKQDCRYFAIPKTGKTSEMSFLRFLKLSQGTKYNGRLIMLTKENVVIVGKDATLWVDKEKLKEVIMRDYIGLTEDSINKFKKKV